MEFDIGFEVPVSVDEAWNILMDIERIAPCVPGAELTEVVDESTYKGKISVKLGPVALTFNGQTNFEERNEAAHRAKLKAQGTDAKGRGGAHANVDFRMEPSDGGTEVLIHTNLQLSGAVAQLNSRPSTSAPFFYTFFCKNNIDFPLCIFIEGF